MDELQSLKTMVEELEIALDNKTNKKQPFSLESGCFFTLLKAAKNRKIC